MNGITRRSRIGRLEALISHPRTGEAERNAAQRMLAGVRANPSERAVVDRRTYGEKYDHTGRLDTVGIAELIRADIKIARKVAGGVGGPSDIAVTDPIGDAPGVVKFSVRTKHFAGGSSINITIKDIPIDWGWSWQRRHPEAKPEPTLTPELTELIAELGRLLDAYNHDGSDPVTDYSDVRFFGDVSYDEPADIDAFWTERAWGASANTSATPVR